MKFTKTKSNFQLTTWEAFNYILQGLVDEITTQFKVDSSFRLTTFQIWAAYLRKCEAVFFNMEEEVLPKLPATFKRQDVEILQNKVRQRKNTEINHSTKFDLQINKVTFKYMRSEEKSIFKRSMILKPIKPKQANQRYRKQTLGREILFVIIFCALNQCSSIIQVSDLIRCIRERRLSYFDCRHFLPSYISEEEKYSINSLYTCHFHIPILKEFSTSIQQFTIFIQLQLNQPNLYELCERYVNELGLPNEIYTLVERLFSICPSDFEITNKRRAPLPFYEARAMAYIIFTLKLLYGLNGFTENDMSKSAQSINNLMKSNGVKSSPIFVWTEWVEYFCARKDFIKKFHSAANFQTVNEYLNSKYSTETFLDFDKQIFEKNFIHSCGLKKNSESLSARHQLGVFKAVENLNSLRQVNTNNINFSFSFTPYTTYLEQLISNDDINVPDILLGNHRNRKVNILLDSKKFKQKLKKRGININIRRSASNSNKKFIQSLNTISEYNNFFHQLFQFCTIDANLNEKLFEKRVTEEFALKTKNQDKDAADYHNTTEEKFSMINDEIQKVMKERRPEPLTSGNNNFFDDIEVSSSEDEKDDSESIVTLLKPHFEYWTMILQPRVWSSEMYQHLNNRIPESFKWLLENCASLLEMEPCQLYNELIILENQFIYVLKPMYEIETKILYQDTNKLEKNIGNQVKRLEKRFNTQFQR
uniref:CSON003344 protein n=1 Tax=Culicoides sonorensis TaxID=179676 RepID=A0A336LM71_CULSO